MKQLLFPAVKDTLYKQRLSLIIFLKDLNINIFIIRLRTEVVAVSGGFKKGKIKQIMPIKNERSKNKQ